jgi:hypothetical protein
VPLTNAQFAQGLRELAAIYEDHPEILNPEGLTFYLPYGAKPEDFRATIRALAPITKIGPKYLDDSYYRVSRTCKDGLTVEVNTDRKSVCRRVQKMQLVDTWECPESILEPEVN